MILQNSRESMAPKIHSLFLHPNAKPQAELRSAGNEVDYISILVPQSL
jgi:hypothetical protein